MSSSNKRARLDEPTLSLDESIDALAAAASAVCKHGLQAFSRAQAKRFELVTKDVDGLRTKIRVREYEAKNARKQEPVEEQVLPLDLLAHALAHLNPKQIALTQPTCKHFKLAALRAVSVRAVRIGLRDTERLSPQMLVTLEEQVKDAADLVDSLDGFEEAKASGLLLLKASHFPTDVVHLHRGTLIQHLTSLVDKGSKVLANYNKRPCNKLKLVLKLLEKMDEGFLAQHVDMLTRLMLASENQEGCDRVLGDVLSVLYTASALPHARTRYLEMDPQLTCFKRQFSFLSSASGIADLFIMTSIVTFTQLQHFTYAELAPLRATMVQIANDQSRGDGYHATTVRTKAREMLFGFDYAAPSSSGQAGGDVTLD